MDDVIDDTRDPSVSITNNFKPYMLCASSTNRARGKPFMFRLMISRREPEAQWASAFGHLQTAGGVVRSTL